jgi:hypothetical protein
MDDGAKTPLSMPYSWPQRIAAIAIAIVSDIVNAIFTWAPPIVIGIDVVTAVLLWVVLGRPMVLLPVFIAEALPGVGIVPFWTLVAGTRGEILDLIDKHLPGDHPQPVFLGKALGTNHAFIGCGIRVHQLLIAHW